MKTLIIIPAYNEQDNIERVVENLRQNYGQFDYVVVNDGSRDKTAEICRARGYNLLDLPVNLGLAGAFQAGVRYARLNGYDAVIQFDGDGQHDAGYIASMVEKMEREKCHIVIGSRFCEEKKPASLRMFGSSLLTTAIRITTGKKITDPTSGMRLFNREMVEIMAKNINYGPEPDTISHLIHCGARVAEVQVRMHDRIAGESYLNLSRSMRYMINMFVSIFLVQLFRPKEMI